MRFGGHETFSIREGWLHKGWLHKGVKLLTEDPEKLAHEHVSDYLGVGRNMAKSIKYWLLAAGIAELAGARNTKTTPLHITEFGETIWNGDPHFLEDGTWWALHINLVHSQSHALTWSWFFNQFQAERFEKTLLVEALLRHLQMTNKRLPSRSTLERDVSCFLASYARTIPEQHVDPEESLECPFRELGLLTFFRGSGYYQLHQGMKAVPREALGYAFALAFQDAQGDEQKADIPLHQAVQQRSGPGRALALTSESLFELVLQVEGSDIEIAGHAGERVIRVARRVPLDWLRIYYRRMNEGSSHAA